MVGFSESICFAVVSQGLHRPPTFLGVVIAVQGVGAVIGGPTAAPLARRVGEGPLMGFGLVLAAAGAGLFAVPDMAGVMSGAILFGAGLPWIIVGAYTMLQLRTPLELQGRVSAAADTILSTPQVLSIAVGAWLVGVVSYQLLLAVMGGTVLAGCGLPADPQGAVGEAGAARGVHRAADSGSCDLANSRIRPVRPRSPEGARQLPASRGLIGKQRSSSLPKA